MKFLKSIGKVFHKVSDGSQKLFNKGEIGGQKLFGKGSIGSHVLGDVSKGLNKAGGVVNQVGKAIGSVVNNPALAAAIGSNPLGQALLGAGRGLSGGLQGVGHTVSLAGDVTKQKNYGGSAGNVAANILERAKDVHGAGSGVTFV